MYGFLFGKKPEGNAYPLLCFGLKKGLKRNAFNMLIHEYFFFQKYMKKSCQNSYHSNILVFSKKSCQYCIFRAETLYLMYLMVTISIQQYIKSKARFVATWQKATSVKKRRGGGELKMVACQTFIIISDWRNYLCYFIEKKRHYDFISII